MELILGTSGWSYNEWVGPFYDEKARKFTRYSEIFETSEINSTFYRYPTKNLVNGLYRSSPPGFIFAVKTPRLITHEKRLRLHMGAGDDLNRFIELIKPLAEKLGPILIQLPPSFSYNNDNTAFMEFLDVLPKNYEFAVEFRHLSWMRPETFEMLKEQNVAYTIVDEPLLPPELHVTADFAYIRWHGHGSRIWYNYDYTIEELRKWVPKVKSVAEKTRRVYGYFNNHFRWQVKGDGEKWGYPGAVKNLVEFLEMLGRTSEKQVEALNKINHWRNKHSQK